MAAVGMLMKPGDHSCPYYRDRGFVLGRGVTTFQLALDYMAKRDSSSRGRQMPSHYSYPEFHIWSVPTPTASQLLPACGMAWGMQLDGKKTLTVATVGRRHATRQGDFYEAVAFAARSASCRSSSWSRITATGSRVPRGARTPSPSSTSSASEEWIRSTDGTWRGSAPWPLTPSQRFAQGTGLFSSG